MSTGVQEMIFLAEIVEKSRSDVYIVVLECIEGSFMGRYDVFFRDDRFIRLAPLGFGIWNR